MSWLAALLRPGAHAQAHVVDADGFEQRGETVVLLRDGRVVHQLPAASVARVETFQTRKAAEDAALHWREGSGHRGGGTLVLEESGAAHRPRGARRGAAVPLEGVSVKISE